MTNIGYRINREFNRPDRSLIEMFKDIPVPNIDDSMNRTAALHSSIKAFTSKRMMGTAYTVNAAAGDNLMLYYALDHAKPGDVIVVANQGNTDRALFGEIMATMAIKRQLAGIVIDGSIRDQKELKEMGFPVFAVANIPNGPYKNGPGEINVPISVAGKVICPGDIIIGDENGVVVIKPEDAEAVHEKALQIMEKEAGMVQRIHDLGGLDLQWMYDKLAQDGVEIK